MAEERNIYVNLPVKDLKASIAFFTKLGFEFDPRFSDENATAMKIGGDNAVMLLAEEFFKTFTRKDVADATATTEVIVAVTASSRDKVDEMVNAALAAGGKESLEPLEMPGMYSWSFQDLDGHQWEVSYMDIKAMGKA